MGQEMLEIINELNSEFSATNISRMLFDAGLISKGVKGRTERFSKLIFLHSDKDEIYSQQEMKFIEYVGDIIIFPDFIKNVSRGNMQCRFVCVDLSRFDDGIYSAVSFMKIMIKALSGFTIFIFKLDDGIHIGTRTFDKKDYRNCTICETNQIEEVLDTLMFQFDDDFFDFYAAISEVVRPRSSLLPDYDELGIKRRGIQYDYIEGMIQIETLIGQSTAKEIERYKEWFAEKTVITFEEQLEDMLLELQYIKSSKVNTLEMLFEADELERLSLENEEKYVATLNAPVQETQVDEQMIAEYGDNPEEMIKLLKMKHGLM